ncbi:MAG: hypothetical protein QM718_07540 [Steroidobacteraceae bacterium]
MRRAAARGSIADPGLQDYNQAASVLATGGNPEEGVMGIINGCADAERLEQLETEWFRNIEGELRAQQNYHSLVRSGAGDAETARAALYHLWELQARQRELASRMLDLHH